MKRREEEALKGTERSRPGLRLPPEMVSEILVRLPAVSVVRFRAACRLFAAITSDPSFITSNTLHSRAAPASLIFEASACPPLARRVYIRIDEGWEPAPMTLEFAPEAGRPLLFASCDGLLCFSQCHYNSHYIFNPFTREWHAATNPRADAELCGFYSHPPSGEHRLLYTFPSGRQGRGLWGFEVFGLGTNAWRRIEDSPCSIPGGFSRCPPVPCRGRLHWLVYADSGRYAVTIFDMETEVISEAPAPEGVCTYFGMLAELGGRVQLCRLDPLGTLAVWILEDYERVAWVKHQTIHCQGIAVLRGLNAYTTVWCLTFRGSRELVFWQSRPSGQQVLVSCDVNRPGHTTAEITGFRVAELTGLIPWKFFYLRGAPYVETLVSYKSFKKL